MKMQMNPKIKGLRDNFVKKYPHLTERETQYDAMEGYMFIISSKMVSKDDLVGIMQELCRDMQLELPEVGPCGARLIDTVNRLNFDMMGAGDDAENFSSFMLSITKIRPIKI